MTGKPDSIKFLVDRSKKYWRQKKLSIPKNPPIQTPTRTKLPVLGTQTVPVKKLDENVIEDKKEFRKRGNELQIRREEQGDGCMYSELQPRDRPIINSEISY